MKKSSLHKKLLISFLAILSVFVYLVRPTPAQANSSAGSASDTVTVNKTVIANCSKALDELAVYDKLLEAKEAEIKALSEKVELQKEKVDLLRQLAETRTAQAESLTEANNALKQALMLKDEVISNKDKEISILKKRKTSLLTIMKAVGIGIGIGLVLK